MANSGLGLTVPPFYDPVRHGYSTNSSTASPTSLVEADIFGGSAEHTLSMTGAITVASNAQLPTATAMYAAMSNPVVGQTWKLRIMNSGGVGAGIWTVINATDSSWTVNGTASILAKEWKDFYVTLTSPTTATIQTVGSDDVGLNITYSAIAGAWALPNTFIVSGYTTPGDAGAGMVMTSQGATSGGVLAIQNAVGTWYQLVPKTHQAYTTNSSTSASLALVAADIYGATLEYTLNLTGAITSASNAHLPTVPALVTGIGVGAYPGQTYKLRIINGGGSSSGVWTIINASDSSWTINGTPTIAITLGYRDFYITLNSLTAATLQSIGSGTLTNI